MKEGITLKRLGNSLWWFFLCIIFLTSCKKDSTLEPIDRDVEKTNPGSIPGDSEEDLLKDSVYLYTYYVYLWQDALPEEFATRSYNTAEAVLEALKGYAKDPSGQPYDRYSFLDRQGSVSEEIEEGRLGSFGFDVRYHNQNDLYVKRVYANSPAGKAGIERGWKIEVINGETKLDAASLEAGDFAFLWDALDAASINLRLKKPDGSLVDKSLTRASFRIEPVLFDKVYQRGGKKIGYFVFDSFIATETEEGSDTYVKQRLDALFQDFSSAGVSEVIVDLRYNGGGAVGTAEYLSDLLVPASGNGQPMYSYVFNDWLKEDGFDNVFAPVKFQKAGALNPERIYFLVTGGTASASELLINNLKPYVDVKLIGEEHTYGKPVGFFPITIFDADLYAVSFKTQNAEKQSDYFDGMPVDKNVSEDVRKNWGVESESMLAQALQYAESGSFSSNIALQSSLHRAIPVSSAVRSINRRLEKHKRHEMFDFRKEINLNRLDRSKIKLN